MALEGKKKTWSTERCGISEGARAVLIKPWHPYHRPHGDRCRALITKRSEVCVLTERVTLIYKAKILHSIKYNDKNVSMYRTRSMSRLEGRHRQGQERCGRFGSVFGPSIKAMQDQSHRSLSLRRIVMEAQGEYQKNFIAVLMTMSLATVIIIEPITRDVDICLESFAEI